MTTTYTSYKLLAADMPRSIERVAAEPMVARETQYFRDTIETVKSVDDFMSDNRLYNYVLKAHGLEDMAYAKAFIRKVLTEGVSNEESFANKLTDSRYRDLARAFDFEALGAAATGTEAARLGTVSKYMRQTLEQNAGEENAGVRLALYFERMAPGLDNMYEILADDALAEVVRTTLGLPPEVAASDIDKQVQLFEKQFSLDDFKDTEKLSRFLDRFTTMWEVANPSAGSFDASSLIGQQTSFGISPDLMLSLNTLKLGGR
ncbi:DUF1217 domain-containing protein [Pararhizobium haloflavum]|uniref:DUF1217 domain-containing protein n=1 Tax=Pararhizobium haloflavum TaxID=2037914 RepID=UPI000C1914B7|nr:DUF1217 domain-containing protein [Pararhizobium haloflavum]